MFGGGDSDESGDALLESVLGPEGLGQGSCSSNFIAEAIIDREVVSISNSYRMLLVGP